MKRKLNAIIIDDEASAREILKGLINLHGAVTIVAEAEDGNEAIKQIIQHSPEIIFLDIDMPGKNGIEIIDYLKTLNLKPFVIFTTAHPEFAIEALDRAAFGYLIKPIDQEKLSYYINRILCINNDKVATKKISFPISKGYLIIDTNQITYALADGNYTHLHLIDGIKHTITVQLGKLNDQLNCNNFIRINRSAIINLDHLKYIDKQKSVCLINYSNNKIELPISKNMIKELAHRLSNS